MSTRISCPGCGRSLRLPTDCTAETLSCPRCLARIPNPQASVTSAAIQAATPAAPAPAAPSTSITEQGPWPRAASVDVDVRRDSRRTSGCLIALAVLGGIGVSWALLGSVVVASESGTLEILFTVLGVLLVFTVSSGLGVFLFRRSATAGANIGRTILGVLAMSGVLVLLLVAGLIFMFVACLVSG